MPEFHTFTLAAARGVLEGEYDTHDRLDTLVFGWGCLDHIGGSTIKRKLLDLARAAEKLNLTARTSLGDVPLQRAIVEEAIKVPERRRNAAAWLRLTAGLRFDGFEIVKDRMPDPSGKHSIFDDGPSEIEVLTLRRMLPEDTPGVDFREAESEVVCLLKKHSFAVAAGHLRQASSAFQRGEWAAANSQLRSFFEDYLNRVADELGFEKQNTIKDKREFLGKVEPPFLLATYNEWNANTQKPQYVQGLWSRMHPEGSHPGLSEEEDATFRLQISLVTARLFLRRFDQRKPF